MLESCYIVFFLRDSMLHYANNSTLLSPNKTCKELPFISLPDAFCAASTWRPWEPSVQASGKTLVLLKLQLRRAGNDYLRNSGVEKLNLTMFVYSKPSLLSHTAPYMGMNYLSKISRYTEVLPNLWDRFWKSWKDAIGFRSHRELLKVCVSSKTALQTDGKTQIENAF